MKKIIIISIGLIIKSCIIYAQPNAKTDTLKIEILLKRIEILEKKVNQQKSEDELQELLNHANQLSAKEKEDEAGLSKKFHSGVRQQQGLNPNISIGGDFFGAVSTSKSDIVTDHSEFNFGNNGMHMRGLEMSFIAPLDPYARGKAFLHLHEDAIEVEEAYMELLNLPFNTSLKVGKLYTEYGLLNRYHEHALPQFDRPKVAVNYFGLEALGGIGLSGNMLLPKLLFADASSFDFSFVEGGNNFSFTTERKMSFLYVGHFKNYYDLSESSYIEYTLSGVTGKNDTTANTNSYIGSFGIHYKWEPLGRSKYRTFDWKTEFYYGWVENPANTMESKGFYTSVQNKLNARFWIGGRIGYSELPYDNKQSEWDYTVCLDYWQSEFVFFRLQYQYNDRNITNMMNSLGKFPSEHSVVLQISWAMGPHKHEAY
ncbi:hypothetical protein ACFLTE_05660 [Bacteroidota bacterium]